MPRYFFAVTPPEPLTSQIEALRARWGHPHHKVEPHITVRAPFEWREEPAAFLAAVRAACSEIAPFDLRLGGPGRFREARVLFLTVAGEGLRTLHVAVLGALEGLVPRDSRSHEGEGYSPHLTLAAGRFGIGEGGLAEMERAAQAELADLPAFTVESLRCYEWNHAARRWAPLCDIPVGR